MAYGQVGSALSGTIAAATSGVLWIARYPKGGQGLYEVRRIHTQVTTLVSYTTLVTAGRGLKLVIGEAATLDAHPSGGASWAMVSKGPPQSEDETMAEGWVASTGALTTSNQTIRANPRHRIQLAHCGVAGSNYDEVWRFDGVEAEPLFLNPGQWVGLATEQALDAGGSLQIQVDCDAREHLG